MKRFAQLFRELDQTTRTSEKVEALERYFREAAPGDAAWALQFLLGRRGRRPIPSGALRQWAAGATGLPAWLVDECYDAVGDLAETIALLLAERVWPPGEPPATASPGFAELVEQHLHPLSQLPESARREHLFGTLARLDSATERFLFLKLLTGGFRMGVSRTLVVRALAAVAGLDRAILEHRLLGDWPPTAEGFRRLLEPGTGVAAGRLDPAQPYPFQLAAPLESSTLSVAGAPDEWQVEWKWDGIRAQLLRRAGQVVLWSRGEEILTPAFPEICEGAAVLPDGTVLDGELLAWREGIPLPFHQLQRRLGRRHATASLRQAVPVVFMAYDLLERDGHDVRAEPLARRRQWLEQIVTGARDSRPIPSVVPEPARQGELFPTNIAPADSADAPPPCVLWLSPVVPAAGPTGWAARKEEARRQGAEGILIKRLDSPYVAGRERGLWWKWKVDPYTIDAVLLAAQPGHGRRAGLFTDYTFGLWQGTELVSFAKAYSGLTAGEIEEVDQWVRAHTTGRHGPVRTVEPGLVFELAFEGLQESPRHKSGLALRFPRIARWRRDKPVAEADTVDSLRRLLEVTA